LSHGLGDYAAQLITFEKQHSHFRTVQIATMTKLLKGANGEIEKLGPILADELKDQQFRKVSLAYNKKWRKSSDFKNDIGKYRKVKHVKKARIKHKHNGPWTRKKSKTNEVPTRNPTPRPSEVTQSEDDDESKEIPTPSPTHPPTKSPTSGPTVHPTAKPTPTPVHPPTKSPTRKPTLVHPNFGNFAHIGQTFSLIDQVLSCNPSTHCNMCPHAMKSCCNDFIASNHGAHCKECVRAKGCEPVPFTHYPTPCPSKPPTRQPSKYPTTAPTFDLVCHEDITRCNVCAEASKSCCNDFLSGNIALCVECVKSKGCVPVGTK
jgi:hypothetical protein